MDLAQAVGCTPERITQWGSSSRPPDQMRKGFDVRLAYALQTTRQMLFEDWQTTPPDAARRVMLHADQLPLEEEFSWDPDLQELIRKILPYLEPPEMEWLLLQAALKVLEKKDNRSSLFRQIIDRYKLFAHYERTGERLPTATAIPVKPGEDVAVINESIQPHDSARFRDSLDDMKRAEAEFQALINKAKPPSHVDEIPLILNRGKAGSTSPGPTPVKSIRKRIMQPQKPTPQPQSRDKK